MVGRRTRGTTMRGVEAERRLGRPAWSETKLSSLERYAGAARKTDFSLGSFVEGMPAGAESH